MQCSQLNYKILILWLMHYNKQNIWKCVHLQCSNSSISSNKTFSMSRGCYLQTWCSWVYYFTLICLDTVISIEVTLKKYSENDALKSKTTLEFGWTDFVVHERTIYLFENNNRTSWGGLTGLIPKPSHFYMGGNVGGREWENYKT